jgi:hypothetical protein
MKLLLKKLRAKRADTGVYMLELIMAIAASGVLSAALVSSMAESEKLSSAGQNQIIASAIAQEQIDNARNTSYGDLEAWAGDHSPGINRSQDGDFTFCEHGACGVGVGNCRLNRRPLQIDNQDEAWSDAAEANRFQGTLQETIAAGPYPDTLRVTIAVNWKEGNANKNYTLVTLISKDGIHN